MGLDTCVESVECWACSIPLPNPLSFGRFVVDSREYVAVRVRTACGLTAECLGLSRRAPIDVVIAELVAPHVLGKDALDLPTVQASIDSATRALDPGGLLGAARSLMEICLWDIRAQAADMPLWQMLGGSPRTLPVLLVEGYALPGESDEAFAERLARRIDEGYRAVKIEGASYRDVNQLARRLSLIRALVGESPEIVIDMAWSWESAAEGAAAIERWSPAGIAWVEDPMPRYRAAEISRLHALTRQALGAGDEATHPEQIAELVERECIDVVRVDALTVGGLDAARQLTELAARHGMPVSTHAHPEIHQHCAFAWDGHKYVEEFPADLPFDLSHRLMEVPLVHPSPGQISPPSMRGSGVRLIDDAVGHYACRHSVTKA